MLSKLRHFWLLPAPHKIIFVKIFMLVPLVELGVRIFGFKRIFKLLNRSKKNIPEPYDKTRLVKQHGFQLYLFQKNFPFLGRCLARSLTVWFLLKKKGVESELKFGMKKENSELLAHAWIEYKGVPLVTDSDAPEEYISFADSILQKSIKIK